MLIVPFLVGVGITHPTWLHVPLLLAWVSGYLLSFFLLQAFKTRRFERVRRPIALYAAVALPLAAVVLIRGPTLLGYAAAYLPLLAVNVGYARLRRERAFVNDLASVLQACLMVFVAASVAGVPPDRVIEPFLVVLLYFVGTVFYVKTMIRERGDRGYWLRSVAFHAVALVGAAALAPTLAIPFGLHLLRAALLPFRPLRPAQVGILEVANSALLVVTVLITFG